jgi:hypothetical protein
MAIFMNNFILTMQFDEDFLLPIFVEHYAKYVPLKNIYVIDHGSSRDFIPPGVNNIYVPRDRPFSEIDRLALIKHISAGLLKYYDYGVYVDCDELIALEKFCEDKLKDSSVVYVAGFEVYADRGIGNSGKQLMGLINPRMCKPLIFRVVPDWVVGFHLSTKQLPADKLEIPMAHVRFLFPEKHRERIMTRRKVFQTMQATEKKAGVDQHWEDGELHLNKFIGHVKHLEDKDSIVLPFDAVDRDKLFSKARKPANDESNSFFFKPKGQYDLLEERYDLSEQFPDLLSGVT